MKNGTFAGIFLFTAILLYPLFGHADSYPAEIEKLMAEANVKILCEKEKPRKVGTNFYKNSKKDWLVLVFTKDGETLEAWHYKGKVIFFGYLYPDKVYYKTEQNWIDKNSASSEEAEKLDMRLKFTNEEKDFFKKCAEEKARALGFSL